MFERTGMDSGVDYRTAAARAELVDMDTWLLHGAIGGVVAGLFFILFEMVMAAVLGGVEAAFMPLRMSGALALGPAALAPTFPFFHAAATGAVVHFVLSALIGMFLGLILTLAPSVATSANILISTATIYGVFIWIANYYVLAPLAGFDWFLQSNNTVQFFAHALFYGGTLGFYFLQVARRLGISARFPL